MGSNSATNTWDCLNRLTAVSGATNATYTYRADGMRTNKVTGGTSSRYRYDGQMPSETLDVNGTTSNLVQNGLGARGIDYEFRSTTTGGNTTSGVYFPLYDAHGNRIATIQRSGTSFAAAEVRSYGAWGEIRQGATSGSPKGRYCANLGHVQDDESGLIYMRARYYEPASGRFISEDPSHDRTNWYAYCVNNPVSLSDADGKSVEEIGGTVELIKTYLKAMGIEVNDLSKGQRYLLAILACVVAVNSFLGLAARCDAFTYASFAASTASGSIANPVGFAISGFCIAAGLAGGVACRLGIILALRNLVYDIYLIDATD